VKWKKLETDIRDLLSTRNQLAHAPVGAVIDAKIGYPSGEVLAEESWLQVYTSQNESLRGKEKPAIKHAELEDHYKAVDAVADRLNEYRNLILSLPRGLAGQP